MTAFARSVTESPLFQHFITGVILFAGVLAGLETEATLRARHGAVFHALDLAIVGIFVVEIALKLAARGRQPLDYFRDGWNIFDCFIVALCLMPVGGPFASVLRLARVLRLLRLVTALPKLRLLVSALLKSLSAMGYVSLLLALLFYIYAVAGVHLFGRATPADFGTLPAALFSLFRVVTLDNWGDVFNRALEHAAGITVTLYFVTFIVFGTMIILNLFIGVIVNGMSEAQAEQAGEAPSPAASAGTHSDALETLGRLSRQVGELQATLAGLKASLERPSSR